jgi:hypothetical protein
MLLLLEEGAEETLTVTVSGLNWTLRGWRLGPPLPPPPCLDRSLFILLFLKQLKDLYHGLINFVNTNPFVVVLIKKNTGKKRFQGCVSLFEKPLHPRIFS